MKQVILKLSDVNHLAETRELKPSIWVSFSFMILHICIMPTLSTVTYTMHFLMALTNILLVPH